MRKLAAMTLCLVLGSTPAWAGFFDNFESYADTAAMLAPTAWGAMSSTDAPATLMAAGGNPGQYMNHPGGKTAKRLFDALSPDANALVWHGDIIDDGVGNKRVTMGLRTDGGGAPLSALLEMGRYNAFPTGSGYGVRTVFLPGSTGWVQFQDGNGVNIPVVAGIHRIQALITTTDITFTLDMNANGTIDSTLVVPAASAGINYNVYRLGGPSDLSSAGGALGFDNVGIYQVPEPAGLALLALGGLTLLRRR